MQQTIWVNKTTHRMKSSHPKMTSRSKNVKDLALCISL